MLKRPLLLAVAMASLAACDRRTVGVDPPSPSLDADVRAQLTRWGIIPIGEVEPQPAAMVDLGRALFFDPVMSGNRDVSCATCHTMADHAGDGLALSIGTGGTGSGAARTLGTGRSFVPRHSPTLLNVGLGLTTLFWDGRIQGFFGGPVASRGTGSVAIPGGVGDVLAAQAMLPVLDRIEMRGVAGDRDVLGAPNELAAVSDDAPEAAWAAVMKRLTSIDGYVAKFGAAFPGTPVSDLRFAHAARAIAAFERAELTRAGSRFDRYLARVDGALTVSEKQGAMLFFTTAGCAQCHNGPLLGGQSFANTGVPQIGPGRGSAAPLDAGADWFLAGPSGQLQFVFRVPPLRNVALTAPYMHDGAYPTLEAVVRHYNDVPKALATYDVTQLAPAFRASYHGDAATIAAQTATLDFRVRTPLKLSTGQQADLVAFLKALTDPGAADLRPIEPASVPSGLSLRH